MAITRSQIARQLYKRGTGIGGAGRGRQDAQSQYGGGSYDSSANRSGRDGSGSDFGQFARRQQQNKALESKGFLGKDLGMNIGEQSVLAKAGDFIKGGGIIGNVLSSLAGVFPSSGTTKPFIAPDRGGSPKMNSSIPLWAQLGFNNEAEYLASLQAQETMDQETEVEEPFEISRRYAAGGGMMDVVGGEYDFESARQMYGLGKLVKKVTRTVKKIAKSPIGKAALIGGGLGFAGMGPFKGLADTNFGTGLTRNFLKFKGTPLGETIFGKAIGDTDMTRSGGLLGLIRDNPVTAGIVGISALAGLMTPEQENKAQQLSDNTGIDIEEARRSILNAGTSQDFRAVRFRAEGGSTEGKEPVAKKTMPLLDMDGMEKDYRETGGFVEMGRMEKADDVPARLSKNEFVFTADAVRNAGEGDVDKGAEVMYNMMKNLEAGGEVSEESQGLQGARKMFQTSQRLEEVL